MDEQAKKLLEIIRNRKKELEKAISEAMTTFTTINGMTIIDIKL